MTLLLWALAIIIGISAGYAWWKRRPYYESDEQIIHLDAAVTLGNEDILGPPLMLRLISDIPRRMHINDSQTIKIRGTATRLPDANPNLIHNLAVQVKMQGAAFEVDPKAPQTTYIPELGNDAASQGNIDPVRWSITPNKSGSEELDLIASWQDMYGRSYEVGAINYRIYVVQFLWLTAEQTQWFAVFSSIVGLLLALLAILLK